MNPSTHPADATAIVYVIDDDASVRAALQDLLASVGLAAQSFDSVQGFLAHYDPASHPAACLVLDVRMPGQSGLEFQRCMHAHGVHLPVVFVTGHGDIPMSVQAMKHGAIEFLTKPFRDQELLDAIHQGIAQDRARLQQDAIQAERHTRWQSLNDGERAVVQGVAQGRLNKQIAHQLGVSEITVKVRRAQAMRKLDVRSVAELVRFHDACTRPGAKATDVQTLEKPIL